MRPHDRFHEESARLVAIAYVALTDGWEDDEKELAREVCVEIGHALIFDSAERLFELAKLLRQVASSLNKGARDATGRDRADLQAIVRYFAFIRAIILERIRRMVS